MAVTNLQLINREGDISVFTADYSLAAGDPLTDPTQWDGAGVGDVLEPGDIIYLSETDTPGAGADNRVAQYRGYVKVPATNPGGLKSPILVRQSLGARKTGIESYIILQAGL